VSGIGGFFHSFDGLPRREWQETKRGLRRHERVSGGFYRTIPRLDYVDASKVDAKYRNGTLTITMPRNPAGDPSACR
jgi:HSP20 family molecular chaperone IbpA